MTVSESIQEAVRKAVRDIYQFDVAPQDLSLSLSEKKFRGSYAVTLFTLAGKIKIAPQKLTNDIGRWLMAHCALIEDYQAVTGFLNLTLAAQAWGMIMQEVNADLDYMPSPTGHRLLIEFSQPNTNKPLHLGHLRNNFLGSALANILEANGNKVHKINIMNDRGIHICKSMVAYRHFGQGRTPQSENMKGDHFVGHYYVRFEQAYRAEVAALQAASNDPERAKKEAPIMQEAQAMLKAWEEGEPSVRALWEKMNDWVLEGFDTTYQRTGTTFDKVYYESDTYLIGKKIVQEGLEKGIFYKKADQSVWINLEEKALGEKLLLRGNGTTVYITQDMGAIDERYASHPFDKHIYVVGNEQERHFQLLFSIMKKLERPYADKLYHLSYGMVDLPSGKMKSREGTTVDADTLIDEMVLAAKEKTKAIGKLMDLDAKEAQRLYEMLALGAIKYFLLRVNPKKGLLFDPTTSIDFQGNTASFIQYTHARISTMLKKAAYTKPDHQAIQWEKLREKAVQDLILQLQGYRSSLQRAAAQYNPSLIADYAYQLAKSYNHFYATLSIINAKDPDTTQRRLYLSWVTALLIRESMRLLGISVPDKM